MTPSDQHAAARLADRIDENLKKIFQVKFGRILTLDEWKALPIATRRALDQEARQQANHQQG
jgi:hypothetical protein